MIGGTLNLLVRRVDALHDAEEAFVDLYGDSSHAFWLDSSGEVGERARFSFMGAADGPLGALVSYDVDAGECGWSGGRGGGLPRVDLRLPRPRDAPAAAARHGLPFDFDCGFVGYFGYELKADCDGDAAHQAPTPDAAFLFADRLVAFDHLKRRTYLLCLTEPDGAEAAERWIEETCLRLASLPPLPDPGPPRGDRGEPVEFHLSRSRARYLDDIAACKRRLFEGDTYEVCLTNKVTAEVAPDPLRLYRTLRRVNPAPFAAFLRLGEVAVLSSSPERSSGSPRTAGPSEADQGHPAARRDAGRGRAPGRGAAADEKSRAENLMIVRPAAQRPRHGLRGRHACRSPS